VIWAWNAGKVMSGQSRPRPVSQLPKAPTKLSPHCVVAETAVLTGAHQISVDDNAVIHPRSRIVSSYTPVQIGAGCIINERAIVGLTDPSGDTSKAVILGKNVVIESAAIVAASEIGQGSIIGVGAKIGTGATIGSVGAT